MTRTSPEILLAVVFTGISALSGCGSGGGGGATVDAGAGGAAASGGQGGTTATGGAAGSAASGGAAGAAGSGGAAGSAGASGAAGATGSGGAPPKCTTSLECKEAQVSIPNATNPPTPSSTECAGGQCGLITNYSGSYKEPKPPRSCTDICAASSYEGSPMVCANNCSVKTINGFGDKGLAYGDDTGTGAGSVAGLVRYQFSPLSGGYKFVEVACSEVPKSKLIQGSNSYTYVTHTCCCIAP